ncbi:alpha-N-acetylglucosaminidase [Xanthomonas prunicola]|uniref:alpha-N-acetylglucosaminidase n=1 Tax=Xanthomonas prunicola TaxID=2053930 RepID=UPI0021B17FD6|nr:alpha-N-acetylglucosaminidase [Xanthomonas prunicola]UXA70334.1 alpha-N-acetylglucosaminidase [Xanthomonas prunicola]
MTASLFFPSSPARLFAVVLGALLATPLTVLAAPPAQAVLQRLIGTRADQFEMTVAPRGDGADWYRIDAGGGTVRIAGSSQVALARGAYVYLGQAGAASMSWEGDRVALPAQWPAYSSGQVRTPFAHRAYLNTCTYGYTTPFWDWPRWQREIDWMALHGIDMPLAMEGQEAIWQALWRQFDVSDDALAEYFSGPAFTPWQRMGNIEGYRAPLPQQWIDSKRVLQKQILTRMRELGMQPVLPAFAGYVPKAFAQAHPHARIYRMRAWEGFHETYWLDPRDPLFAKVARRFLELYTQTYGAGQFYLADAFNEMLPPVADDGSDVVAAKYGDSIANSDAARAKAVPPAQRDARLAEYGQALYRSIAQVNPQATWVMQGWLFGADREFWQPQAIAAFLGKVPDARLMVLDIGNDRYPGTWKAAQAFDNKQWIYGYVHNYGASNPLYGDFAFYRQDLQALLADPDKRNLRGFGVFPEGLHSNSVVYDYLYALAWEGPQQSWSQWLTQYTRARYGRSDAALLQAWSDLEAGIYQTRYWSPRWWNKRAGAYLLFKRPTADIVGFDDRPGDPQRLRRAIDALLQQADRYTDAPLYRYDLIEDARHYLSLQADRQLQAVVQAYNAGDFARGDAQLARTKQLVQGLDALVGGQHETLADWTGQAAAAAGNDAGLRRTYVGNARAQVSVWGGDGNLADYASKAWQGMYADFYLQRWTRFLGAYRAARKAGTPFDAPAVDKQLATWERQWAAQDALPKRQPPRDPLSLLHTLLMQVDASDPAQSAAQGHAQGERQESAYGAVQGAMRGTAQ